MAFLFTDTKLENADQEPFWIENAKCTASGFGVQLGISGLMFWCEVLIVVVYATIIRKVTAKDLERYELPVLCIGVCYPVICALGPVLFDKYTGITEFPVCWIASIWAKVAFQSVGVVITTLSVVLVVPIALLRLRAIVSSQTVTEADMTVADVTSNAICKIAIHLVFATGALCACCSVASYAFIMVVTHPDVAQHHPQKGLSVPQNFRGSIIEFSTMILQYILCGSGSWIFIVFFRPLSSCCCGLEEESGDKRWSKKQPLIAGVEGGGQREGYVRALVRNPYDAKEVEQEQRLPADRINLALESDSLSDSIAPSMALYADSMSSDGFRDTAEDHTYRNTDINFAVSSCSSGLCCKSLDDRLDTRLHEDGSVAVRRIASTTTAESTISEDDYRQGTGSDGSIITLLSFAQHVECSRSSSAAALLDAQDVDTKSARGDASTIIYDSEGSEYSAKCEGEYALIYQTV
jgi:hypothetical protein